MGHIKSSPSSQPIYCFAPSSLGLTILHLIPFNLPLPLPTMAQSVGSYTNPLKKFKLVFLGEQSVGKGNCRRLFPTSAVQSGSPRPASTEDSHEAGSSGRRSSGLWTGGITRQALHYRRGVFR